MKIEKCEKLSKTNKIFLYSMLILLISFAFAFEKGRIIAELLAK